MAMAMKWMLVLLPVALQAATLSEGSSGNPVRKVIELLSNMQSKLEEEQEIDQGIYDKQACWCKGNIENKTESVEKAKKRIVALTNGINMLATKSARLKAEAVGLGKDIEKTTASIEELVARRKDRKEIFQKYEKKALELVNQVVAAEKAVAAASKANDPNGTVNSTSNSTAAAFLQQRQVGSILAHLKKQVAQQIALFADGANSNIQAFLASPLASQPTSQAFLQQRGAAAAGDSPESSEAVMGVLTGLERDFIANLGDLRTKETQQLMTFNELRPAKEAEVKAMTEQKANNEATATDADLKRENNKKVIKNLKVQIVEDSEFLADVKDKCRLIDKEWDARQKARQHETEVLTETKAILQDNYDTSNSFDRASLVQDNATGKVASEHSDFWSGFTSSSFLQEKEDASSSSRRLRIFETLLQVGEKHDARLVTLAMQSKVSPLTRVKESIDDMVRALSKEMKDEVKHNDYCIAELNANQLDAEDKTRTRGTQSAAITEMKANVEEATDDISGLKGEIAELQKQIKLAAENREEENKEFQGIVNDQRVTQRALQKALSVMAGFYPSEASFVQLSQRKQDSAQPQPEGFKEMKKNYGGKGVTTFIQQLLEDSKTIEAEAAKDEQDSQTAYEDFANKTTQSIKTKQAAVRELDQGRAKEGVRKEQKEEEKDLTISELEQLNVTKDDLHKSCDWILAQFTVRQKARGEEMEALKQAKAIISGAKQDALGA